LALQTRVDRSVLSRLVDLRGPFPLIGPDVMCYNWDVMDRSWSIVSVGTRRLYLTCIKCEQYCYQMDVIYIIVVCRYNITVGTECLSDDCQRKTAGHI